MAGHRRPGAAVGDLDGDAVVRAAGAEQRQRVLEVAGDARADVQRGSRPPRHRVHRVAAGDRRHHGRHLRPAVGEALDAQGLAGERADGAASTGGVRPRVRGHASQLHRPPQRALACRDQVAVLTGALEDQGRRRVRGAGCAGGIAQPHLLVGADDQPQLAKWTAVAERLHRHRRQHQAALHVGDAGAEAVQPLAPERPLGDGAQREDGVAVPEQCDHPVALAGQ